jgi:hypothetical protein
MFFFLKRTAKKLKKITAKIKEEGVYGKPRFPYEDGVVGET